ncbi:fibronectin type III domain-containing protein [Blautia schinkii]|nr:fibronectin type III domain-containing protein [Blautia schinkii]
MEKMKRMKKMFLILALCFVTGIGSAPAGQLFAPVQVQAAAKITVPKLVSAKDSGADKAVVKWQAVKGVNGYRVYRKAAGQSFKAVKTVSGASKVSYTDSGLKMGTRYYYTVKAYKKSGDKTVWSAYDNKGVTMVAGLSKLKLNKSALTLAKGKTYSLKLNNTSLAPKWISNNTGVATVSGKGVVTAKSKGTATITASLGGRKFTCKVTVSVPATVPAGINKLKKYITTYGQMNTQGNKCIEFDYNENSWVIVYEASKKRFEFLCFADMDEINTQSVMAMYVNAGTLNYVNPEFIFFVRDVDAGFRATARFKASTYTSKTNVRFNIIEATHDNLPDIQELGNTNLNLAFVGWQALLETEVGISLKNIGFTSYK